MGDIAHLWVAIRDNKIVGKIYMVKEDNMRIKFSDTWVYKDDDIIFRELLDTRWNYVQDHYLGWAIYS